MPRSFDTWRHFCGPFFTRLTAFLVLIAVVGPPAGAANTPKNDILFELDGLWSMRADGTNRRRVTSSRHLYAEASWSPDGSRIVLNRYRTETRNWDLYLSSASGDPIRRLTKTGASERDVEWSPDGRWIAFTRGARGIFFMRPDGTGIERFSPHGAYEAAPAWAPNSRRLAFLSDRRDKGRFDLYVARRNGTGAKLIRDLDGEAISVDWGATGWIAIDHYGGGATAGTYLVRPSGNSFHRVGRRGDTEPVWSPNGRRLLVFNQRDSGFGIWVMKKDGSGRVHLSDEGGPRDWIRR